MAEKWEALGQGCGCYIQAHGTWITYCPMHKAAPEMLAALEHEHQKRLDLGWPDPDATQADRDDDARIAQEFREGKLAAGCDACKALAAARGPEVGT